MNADSDPEVDSREVEQIVAHATDHGEIAKVIQRDGVPQVLLLR